MKKDFVELRKTAEQMVIDGIIFLLTYFLVIVSRYMLQDYCFGIVLSAQ